MHGLHSAEADFLTQVPQLLINGMTEIKETYTVHPQSLVTIITIFVIKKLCFIQIPNQSTSFFKGRFLLSSGMTNTSQANFHGQCRSGWTEILIACTVQQSKTTAKQGEFYDVFSPSKPRPPHAPFSLSDYL